MANLKKKTKIVATIGLVSETSEMLAKMSDAGVNIFRLNFSHGDYAEHGAKIEKIRNELKLPGAILLDTKGPEIRTGKVRTGVEVKTGDELVLTINKGIYEDTGKLSVSYTGFVKDVDVGDVIVIKSGAILAEVIKKTKTDVITKIVSGKGTITSKRHINLRGKKVSLPTITDKDWDDIDFGIEQKVDFIALSFVRSAKDIKEVRDYCHKKGEDIKIIAKIENYEAVQNLEEITKESDGVMVARGDLACEISFPKVPAVQRQIMELCEIYKKPVIVATQMMASMVESITPTRAEVMDVSTAVWNSADAVMLSDETTKSEDPSHVVKMMASIAMETEKELSGECNCENECDKGCGCGCGDSFEEELERESIAESVINIADSSKSIEGIVVITKDGKEAELIANLRPETAIYPLTDNQKVKNQMELLYNTYPQVMDLSGGSDDIIERAEKLMKKEVKRFVILIQDKKNTMIKIL